MKWEYDAEGEPIFTEPPANEEVRRFREEMRLERMLVNSSYPPEIVSFVRDLYRDQGKDFSRMSGPEEMMFAIQKWEEAR